MYEIGTNLAYENDGTVVLSKAYVMTDKEREAAALAANLRANGMTRVEAGVHAIAVLPPREVDPDFVQFLTGGVVSISSSGEYLTDETTRQWLTRIRRRS